MNRSVNVLLRGEAREKSSLLWGFVISRVLRPSCDQPGSCMVTTLVGNSRAKRPEKSPSGWQPLLPGCFSPTRTCSYEFFYTLFVWVPHLRRSAPLPERREVGYERKREEFYFSKKLPVFSGKYHKGTCVTHPCHLSTCTFHHVNSSALLGPSMIFNFSPG